MNINNKYFDVVLDEYSFYITESATKPKVKDSAIVTLTKIEYILKNKLIYSHSHQDAYSNLNSIDLLTVLKKKSVQIHTGYTEKQARLFWIFRKLFSKEKIVAAIHKKIENLISPPKVFPHSNNLTQLITKNLNVSELAVFAQLNRHGKTQAATSLLKRAKEYGYEGEDAAEAKGFLMSLWKEIKILYLREQT